MMTITAQVNRAEDRPAGNWSLSCPNSLCRPFYHDRKLLTGLCRSAVEATHEFYRAGLGRDDLRVGMVVVPQRFGDKVNPHIHLHALSTDGAFDADGVYHPMPFDMQGDIEVLTRLRLPFDSSLPKLAADYIISTT